MEALAVCELADHARFDRTAPATLRHRGGLAGAEAAAAHGGPNLRYRTQPATPRQNSNRLAVPEDPPAGGRPAAIGVGGLPRPAGPTSPRNASDRPRTRSQAGNKRDHPPRGQSHLGGAMRVPTPASDWPDERRSHPFRRYSRSSKPGAVHGPTSTRITASPRSLARSLQASRPGTLSLSARRRTRMHAASYLRHGKNRAGLLNANALDEDWIAPELSIVLASMSRRRRIDY
jgi:hypothetical protein